METRESFRTHHSMIHANLFRNITVMHVIDMGIRIVLWVLRRKPWLIMTL